MPWRPLPRIAFGICTYPFAPSSPADLPLEIGDELYIIEQGGRDGEWYRGYLVAPPSLLAGLTSVKGATLEARVFSGIFPRCCIEVREQLGHDGEHNSQPFVNGSLRPQAPVPMLKVGDESPTSTSEPLVDEIAEEEDVLSPIAAAKQAATINDLYAAKEEEKEKPSTPNALNGGGEMVLNINPTGALGFCAGCFVFGHLMRLGVIPEETCEACADISRRRPAAEEPVTTA